jgi:hypothetical protein
LCIWQAISKGSLKTGLENDTRVTTCHFRQQPHLLEMIIDKEYTKYVIYQITV